MVHPFNRLLYSHEQWYSRCIFISLKRSLWCVIKGEKAGYKTVCITWSHFYWRKKFVFHTHTILGYINRGDHRSYIEVSDLRRTLTRWSSPRKGWLKWRRVQNHVIWIRIERTESFPNWDKKTQSRTEGYGANENTHSMSWKLLRDTGEVVTLQGMGSSKAPWTRCRLNLALNSKAEGGISQPLSTGIPISQCWHFLVPLVWLFTYVLLLNCLILKEISSKR